MKELTLLRGSFISLKSALMFGCCFFCSNAHIAVDMIMSKLEAGVELPI